MPTKPQTTCSFCGRVKTNAEQWYRLWEGKDTVGVSITPLDEGALLSEDDIDACSDACVTKGVQLWLSKQTEQRQKRTVEAVEHEENPDPIKFPESGRVAMTEDWP